MKWENLPLFASQSEEEPAPAPNPVAQALEKARQAATQREAEAAAPQVPAEPAVPEGHGSATSALTVSELTQRLRGVLEPAFATVWLQGEVSNYRPAASGHAYFSLKDSQASISAVIFGWGKQRGLRGRPSFELKDGLQVLCRGKVAIYPARGSYQIVIDQVEPLGAGALQVAFEQLKARLQSEGLFDPARKRPLPLFPLRVAIVTSPSGAAVRDMLNILSRRAPHVEVTVVPAVVQGDQAPPQIIRGLEQANRWNLGDVVVLARGGGSIEDLWCFNDEALARAIAASRLPVVSAVGHEIDFTISDFVSDLRAPTPSAAAELVTAHWVDLGRRLLDARARLQSLVLRELQSRQTVLRHVAARLQNPRDRLREQAQRTDELFSRLERAMGVALETRRSRLGQVTAQLDALSPLKVLERGYSIVRDVSPGGGVVRSVTQVRTGQELQITFTDGQRNVQVQ